MSATRISLCRSFTRTPAAVVLSCVIVVAAAEAVSNLVVLAVVPDVVLLMFLRVSVCCSLCCYCCCRTRTLLFLSGSSGDVSSGRRRTQSLSVFIDATSSEFKVCQRLASELTYGKTASVGFQQEGGYTGTIEEGWSLFQFLPEQRQRLATEQTSESMTGRNLPCWSVHTEVAPSEQRTGRNGRSGSRTGVYRGRGTPSQA